MSAIAGFLVGLIQSGLALFGLVQMTPVPASIAPPQIPPHPAVQASSTGEQEVSSTPSVTIDQSSLTTASLQPIITGTATGASTIGVRILEGGAATYTGSTVIGEVDTVPVVNGHWSLQLTPAVIPSMYNFGPGTYTINAIIDTEHQTTATLTVTSSSSTSNSLNNTDPTIDIATISGDTITVRYFGLSTTYEGPTPPSSLWIQDNPSDNPIDVIAMGGASSGSITFKLPANIPAGDYTIIPVGIPATPPAEGKAPGPVSYGAVASFNVSSDGSVKIVR